MTSTPVPAADPASPAPGPRFVPLSRSTHAGKRWRRFADYRFAASQMLLPVITFEIAKVAVSMPVAFARSEAGYFPVALLGLEQGSNLFVDEQGRWLADYVPAGLRGQPFALGRGPAGQLMLCIDEGSPLVGGSEGEPFFTEQGEVTEDLRKTMEFLSRVEQGRAATIAACEALARHECIAPLAFSLQGKDGKKHRLEGLYQFDEAAFGKLAGPALEELRNVGAVALAFAQSISLQKLPLLPALAARRAGRAAPGPDLVAGKELDLSFLEKDGTFGFDAFR